MGRAEQRSIVAKVRVYELAKEFGVESKAVMTKLEEMGEFVRSASSTIEAPVVRRLKEAFNGGAPRGARSGRPGAAGSVRAGAACATGRRVTAWRPTPTAASRRRGGVREPASPGRAERRRS